MLFNGLLRDGIVPLGSSASVNALLLCYEWDRRRSVHSGETCSLDKGADQLSVLQGAYNTTRSRFFTGKNSRSKKDPSFPLPSTTLGASQAPFSRGVEWLLHESGCSRQMQHVKIVLKQATERALFPGVTFGIGWSYFWKYVWPKNTFPFIIYFFKCTR